MRLDWETTLVLTALVFCVSAYYALPKSLPEPEAVESAAPSNAAVVAHGGKLYYDGVEVSVPKACELLRSGAISISEDGTPTPTHCRSGGR